VSKKLFNFSKIARKTHKWLMLFIGTQFVIWTITGTYMVFFDIDYIHGDSLVINHQTKINPDNIHYTLAELLIEYPEAKNIIMTTFLDEEVYLFSSAKKKYLIAARNGQLLSPLNKNSAIKAARHYYAGNGEIVAVTLITENPPFELSPSRLPAWRINFDDFGAPSIYVSAQTGMLVGKRHEFWRLFDWMFRFHIMDYGDDERVDNQLLFWFVLLGIFAAISGLIVSYYSVFKPQAKSKTEQLKTGVIR